MEYEIQAAVDVGVYEWFHVKSQFIYDEKGEPKEIFGTMENIQWKKSLERKASHDLMTQVLNKVSFEEKVSALFDASTNSSKHALVFIDLDDFKGVNDSLGHAFGDFLLISVGKRLQRVVRESDLIGRVGGDEFVLLLRDIGTTNSALVRANIMLETLRREFCNEGKSKSIKASLGVAIYPEHGQTYKELIHKSDIALYSSKGNGKNLVTLYNPKLETP